jgi:hypothetical protein
MDRKMKLALPSRKDCEYIRRKLKIFYETNKSYNAYPNRESNCLERALTRLFKFFQLTKPRIVWYEHFGLGSNTLGRCTLSGEIELITPFHYDGSFESWLDTFYHEIGHYVLWYDTEKKAKEFAGKMRVRG